MSRTSNAPAASLGTIHYIYDLDGHLIAEADGATGATVREYLWVSEGPMQRSGGPLPFTNANDNTSGSGNDTLSETALPQAELGGGAQGAEGVPDHPLAVIDGVNTATKTTSYIHTDHLGRPTCMTNAAKATVWSAVWTPWGEAQAISGSVTQNLRFPGQYFQIETGLAYNWHRHYDPVTGRFTQPDPLRFVDGPSMYAYARSSPFIVIDRDGRCPMCVAATPYITAGLAAIGDALVATGGLIVGWTIGEYCMNAARGNVAASRIVSAWAAAGGPKDKCKWLSDNMSKFKSDEVKMTEKAWGCRRSRANR